MIGLLPCCMQLSNGSCRIVKVWDARAMGAESSKRGQGCLASLEIHGAGVWAIDWMQRDDGKWLGAVAGMCGSSLCHATSQVDALPSHPFTLTAPNRYSGLHLISLSLAAAAPSNPVLQLAHSSESIHGDGALVRCAI